jgi:CRISPR-associated protein Csh2
MNTIANNSDLLFLYEAIQSNPNGDPDQENKPRMDYDTKTNLVTDVRIKRFIRDYLKWKNHPVFVDMEGDSKVTPEDKLKAVIRRSLKDENFLKNVFSDKPDYLDTYQKIFKENDNDVENVLNTITAKQFKHKEINFYLLAYLIKQEFIDIRLFGSAFAVPGFNNSYTGPVQLNWGYSLNKVELMDSDSLVTIMSDESSTFGKDYRVHYSLLAFNGTVNKYAAQTTGLNENDMNLFRDSIWKSITALPTRSKLNQYPKLYLEIIYNDDYHNGYFGDLRTHIEATPKEGIQDKQVRSMKDLNLDLSKLEKLIHDNKGENKPIKEVVLKKSDDIEINV